MSAMIKKILRIGLPDIVIYLSLLKKTRPVSKFRSHMTVVVRREVVLKRLFLTIRVSVLSMIMSVSGVVWNGGAAAANLPQQLLGLQIALPDDQLNPGPPPACLAGTGIIVTRCAFAFVDDARFGQTDYVIVYIMADGDELNALKADVDAQLPTGKTLQLTNITVTNKSGGNGLQSSEICEQGFSGPVMTYAVCLANNAANTIVATAVYPGTSSTPQDANNPPDIVRAQALEQAAMQAVYSLIAPNSNE